MAGLTLATPSYKQILPLFTVFKNVNMLLKILILCCILLLLQLGDGQVPTNRPSNGK